jgi:hypothetical protein
MTAGKSNLPASVAARLLNRAKQTGDVYQTLLTSFCFERFLYRLGQSDVRERFVLKGAMLLRVWSDQPYRATRDLDLLRMGDGSFEAIRAEDEYAGTRATLPARCGTARLSLQIDMGHGDSVWPAPRACVYPALLDFPAPQVLAYPRESVVAEKLEALVVLGDRNSRIKDFFDLHHLASQFEFDRETPVEAVGRTFARRRTTIPVEPPIGLTPAYWDNPSRPAQVRAFARRAGLAISGDPARDLAGVLSAFLLPVLEDAQGGTPREGTWPAGGPWRPSKETPR